MTDTSLPSNDAILAPPPIVKVKRLYRLQNTTMMRRMMPQLQHKLLEMVRRWGSGDDDIALSEREVKVLTHLIGVLEKIIAVEERAKQMEAQNKTTETNEVSRDFESIRIALASRLQSYIDTSAAGEFSTEFE